MDVIKILIKKPLFQIGALIILAGFIFLLFAPKPFLYVIPEREDIEVESISSAVVAPNKNEWQRETFIAEIKDSVRNSEFATYIAEVDGCEYLIEDFGSDVIIGGLRECGDSFIRVTVGNTGVCSSSYNADDISKGKCRVSTRAFNVEGENSGWSSRTFNVDIIKPVVGIINSLPDVILPNIEYTITSNVLDNADIAGCQLFINRKDIVSTKINPIPCENGNECSVETKYTFENPGVKEVLFGCSDTAGNVGYGAPFYVNVFVNHAPKIASCRVISQNGAYKFLVDASDIDGDELSYLWDFGDGSTSIQLSPLHPYSQAGTYTPKVIVSDKEESVACSTAWVVVE